jgi:ribose 5-phosphate isomerase A
VHNPKEVAGRRAAEFVESGMRVGLGTGSTVHFTLLRLAERMAEGLKIVGVPTSIDTQNKARALGIPLADLESVEALDLTIDGADEIDGRFDMIKGGGGALLREKVVASITRRQIAIVGADKVVARLGAFPLPVEVVPFALAVIRRALERKGAGVVPPAGQGRQPLRDGQRQPDPGLPVPRGHRRPRGPGGRAGPPSPASWRRGSSSAWRTPW